MQELGIFAKYWEPGRVKTRLAATLGNELASQIYQHFLTASLERFRLCGDQRTLVFTPEPKRAAFEKLVGPRDWQLLAQQGDDLGERMSHFFEDRLEAGAESVVLIGSDSPTLPQAIMTTAFKELRTHDLVIGPSADGGYYLIGMRKPLCGVFCNVDWSSSQVWTQTLQRVDELGEQASLAVLPEWYDVDTLDDLERLFREIEQTAEASPSLIAIAECCSQIFGRSESGLSKDED